MNFKKIIGLGILFLLIAILTIFWGCQQGTSPTPPFFNVWSIDSIYAITIDNPDEVIAGQNNTVCAYITGQDEKGNVIPLPTTELVYFTIVADTISSTSTIDKDTLWRAEQGGVNPSTPGTACMSFFLPSNSVGLTVVVSVVGYDEYSKYRTFTVITGTEYNTLMMQLDSNSVTVGGGQVGVTVWVKDAFGQPVQNEFVCFSTTDPELGVMADSCLFSDNAGMCVTSFITGTKSGIDTICATDHNGISVCGQIIINPEVANTESLFADTYHIYRCGSGLCDQTDIYARIYDRYWNPVRNGTPVIFSIDTFTYMDSCSNNPVDTCYACPGLEPQHPTLGRLYSDTVYTTTDSTGSYATVKLKAGYLPGVVRLRCDVLDGSGTVAWSSLINISSGQPHYISLSARPPGTSTWEAGDPMQNYYSAPIDYAMWGACTQDSMPLEIMAVVSDEFNNPIPNASVWFTATSGVVGGWPGSPSVAVNTDSTGIGTTYWFSSDRRELDSCFVMIKAYSSETSVADSLFFYLRYTDGSLCCNPCNSVSIVSATATPDTIEGSGTDSSTIAVQLDYGSLPLSNYQVRFSARHGWLSSNIDTTNENGIATVYYSAINPSPSIFVDTVVAIAGDSCAIAYIPVYVVPAAVALNITLIADDYNPTVGGQEVNLAGMIRDIGGSPINIPLPITWTITTDTGAAPTGVGDFVSYSYYSDTLGTFSAVFQTGTVSGVITINAIVAGSGTASVNLNILPASVLLAADNYNPEVGGVVVHLSGSVIDYLGDPVRTPAAVSWSLILPDGSPAPSEMGHLDSLSMASDTNGTFKGVYISGTTTGEVLVVADVAGIGSDTVELNIHSGPPASILLDISPSTDTVGGLVPDTISGCVVDAYGNSVEYTGVVNLWLAYDAAGDSICYPCSYGSIEPTGVIPDSTGCFTALFSPGVTSGLIWIHALADSAHGVTSITLMPQLARSESLAVSLNHIRTCGNAPYQSEITSYVFDQFGNPVADLTPIIFAIDTFSYMDACTTWDDSCLSPCPRLIPSNPILGPLYSDTIYTIDGVARATLKAGSVSGVVRAAAYVMDGSGEVAYSQMINISSGEVQKISISARKRSNIDTTSGHLCIEVPPYTCEYCSWTYDWWSGNPDLGGYAPQLNMPSGWVLDGDTCNSLWMQVRISVSDTFGNPIPDATIHLSCDEGVIGGYPSGPVDSIALTDSNGLAYTYWYAADPRIDGQVWIKAHSSDIGVGDSLWFYLLDTLGIPPYDTVEQEVIYVVPDTVFGDGLSTVDIMCRVMRNGNPLPHYPVYFYADTGMITSPVFTDSIGYARTTYYSGLNHNPGVITTDSITMIAGIDTQYFHIYLLPVDPIRPYVAYIMFDLEPDNISVGDTAVLSGLILDGLGYPVRLPVPVYFALHQDGLPAPLNMGTISPGYTYTSFESDSFGRFSTVYRSGTQAGDLWLLMTAIQGADTVTDSVMIHITGSSPQTVTVVPASSYLEADGRSNMQVVATVQDMYGNPVEGVTVDFSTTLGQISPTTVTTDANGQASTILISGTETGTAIITASCEGQVGTASVDFVSATVHFIILSVDPSRLTADGISTATVSADVRDQYGQPISDGTIVSYRCLTPAHIPIGSIDTIGITSGGVSTVTLTAPTTATSAWVFATAMSHIESVYVEFTAGDVYSLEISAAPDTIPADGLSQSDIFVRAYDQYGNPVESGNRIDYSASLGELLFDHSFTDDTGFTQTTLTSARTTGFAQITASSGDVEAIASVYFSPITAHSIVVMSDSVSLCADGVSSTNIRAVVFDSLGSSVPDGTPVSFSSSMGILIPGYAYTDSGEAVVLLRAPTTPGIDTVIADAGGGIVGTTYVEFTAGAPANIVMSASPNVLPADGDTTAIVSGTVYDENSNPVGAGFEVRFQTTLGSVDSLTYTDSTGSFSIIYHAGITPGTAIIGATSGSAHGQTYIDIIPTDAEELYITIDPNELTADSRSTANVSGRVTNTLGNPVADGTPVRLEIHCADTLGCNDFGEIMPVTVPTDSGNFSAVFIAGTRVGRVWIIASVGTVIDSAFVNLVPGEVDSIAVDANPDVIPADSFSYSLISANLFDVYGNPVSSGIDVDFSTTSGTILPEHTTTNSSGYASAVLTSSRTPGVARVQVISGSAIGEDTVVFSESGAGLVVVTINPSQVVADGVSSAIVTAQITDTLGNPISDGVPVMFSEIVDTAAGADTLGVLVPSIAYTSGGEATVQFRARTKKGTATVRACIDSLHCGEGIVEFIAGNGDSIELYSADSTLPADGVSFTEITAIVYDRYGNLVEGGRSVTFATTSGGVAPATAPTNSAGQAKTILTSSDVPGIAWITAQCEDGYATIPVEFGLAEPVFLAVSANPRRIAADGISTSTITARLINAVGEPVVEGTMIIFHAFDSLGNPFGDIDTLATTTGGQAQVTLTAPTQVGIAYVTAAFYGETDTLIDTTTVTYTPGPPAGIDISVSPETLYANDTVTAQVRIVVVDLYGNPVEPGQSISISTDNGTIFPTTAYTGDTVVCTYYPGSVAGRATINVTCGSIVNSAVIELLTPTIAYLVVFSDSSTLVADGSSTSEIHIIAQDALGHPVADNTPVYLTTTAGLVFPGIAYTSGGEAVVNLRSGTVAPETAMVVVSAGVEAETVYVPFIAGPPAMINIVPNSTSLFADGEDTTTVRAYITDAHGNWVSEGTNVRFSTSLGTIDSLTLTTAVAETTGFASARFRAGIIPGSALITATSGDAIAQTIINLIPTDVGNIYLTVDPNELTADSRSTADVSGRVTNTLGNPITDGTPVNLEIHCSDTLGCEGFGEIVPITVHTDSGNFDAEFTAGTRVGRVWVIASVDTVSDSAFIDLIPGEPDSIALDIVPNTIPADSFSSATVTASLYDRFGNPVGSGVTVNFSTTLGSLDPTSTTTNSSGRATTYLTSGRTSGIALVHATSGSASGEDTVVFTQTGAHLVVVTIDPAQIVADGINSATVSAQVSDSLGNPVSDGMPVMFAQIVDTAAGEDTLGLLVPSIGFTDSGVATIRFRAGTETGRATIQACVDTFCGIGFIDLTAGTADSIVLVSADTMLPADGVSMTTVTANIYDRYGNSVEGGRSVSFNTTLGQIYPTTAPTSSGGQANAVLTSSDDPGLAWITAQCEDAYASIMVDFGMMPPVFLSVNASPRRITADGISTSTITAHLINGVGAPVPDGTMIFFHSVDSTGAPFGDIDTIATTVDGDASVVLTADTQIGVAYVSALWFDGADSLTDTVTVTFTPGPVAAIQVTADRETLYANDTLTARVTIVVTDVFGNLVEPGQSVSISVDNGDIYPTTGYTGDTIVCTYYPGSVAGRAVITAECGGFVGSDVIELLTQSIANLVIYSDSAFLIADGTSTTSIHIVAQDSMGHPVADNTPVYITTTAGVTFPGVTYTSGGEAIVTLRSSTHSPETAMVVATAGLVADTVSVVFIAGPPALINLVPARNVLWADGEDTTMVRAYITDIHGNWVDEGEIVSFSTNIGTVDSFDVTHAVAGTTGYAQTMFRSGIEPGAALVTATCGDASGIARLTLDPTNVGEIGIFATPDIIVADGHQTSNITGFVRNNLGNPISDGTQVRLRVSPDSLGNISPVSAYTDSGNFSATFTAATTVGSVWVVMSVGGDSDSVAIELAPGQPHIITMTPIIGTIPADSSSVDTIAVVVADRYGNRVQGGVSIDFTTTLGEVFPDSNETNSAGSTYVFIRSGYNVGVARVVGRIDSARGECSVVIETTQPHTIALAVDPHTLMADGFSTTSLTATVLDTFGHPISDGTPVIFSVDDSSYGLIFPGIAYTSSGQATSTFRAATHKGHPVLKAETSPTTYDSVIITLTAGNPASIVLTATPETLSANGMDQSDIDVQVFDEWLNPVDAGQSVSFNSTLGQILFPTLLTDDSGHASTVLQAGSVPGNCQVSAQCGGVYDVIDVTFLRSGVNTIILTANPSELVVDGISSSAITAQVFDVNGSPVTDNTKIYFWTNDPTAGTVISPKFTSGGQVVTEFISGTSIGAGEVWIFASDTDTIVAGHPVDSVRIGLKPGDAAYINVWADTSHTPRDTLYADGNDGVWIFAQVFDAYGNHINGGQNVTFATTMGRFTPTSAMTDTTGTARAFIQSGLDIGTATITVTCGSAMGIVGIEMIQTQVAGLLLTPSKLILVADGTDVANITASVFAPGGTPVSNNTIVHFYPDTNWVHLLPENTYTDSGEATITVRADTIATSSIRIYAYATTAAGDTSDTASLNFRIDPGPAARMDITVSDSTIPADGATGSLIDVWVYDRYSNPIIAGSTVRFSTTLGTITTVSFTDTLGHSSALLTSGTETGNAVITITAGDITGFTQVRFYELTTDELIMTVSPIQLPADGVSSATVTVHAYDSLGFPASDGSRIAFSQHDTTGGFVKGIIAPHIAYTSDGMVTVTLTAPVKKGWGRIYAYADTVGSAVVDSFDVQYLAGDPAIIQFDTTYFDSFAANGMYFDVPVVVLDAYGNPVDVGTEVTFTTTLGSIQSPAVVSNDTGGAVTYITSHETGPAVITAHSGSAVATAHCNFSEVEGDWIMVIASPYIITADGVSQSTITATLMDTTGGIFIPVSDGVPVQFMVSGPGILSTSIAFTSGGQASTELTAGTVSDTTKVYALAISATGDTLLDSVSVYLQPGSASIVEFIDTFLHDLPANGADTEQVWIKVMDAFGNGVIRGTPVSFTTNLGDITPNSATDDSGYAWAILTASSSPGVATISASCGGASGYATVSMQELTADSIILAVYPREIVADGASTSELTAVVFHSDLPVSDGTIVRFSASRGITRPAIAYTSSGVATSQLVSSVSPDTVFVEAISGAVADTDTVYLVPGPPTRMTIETTPDSVLIANGNDTLRVNVQVFDDYSNPVGSGQLVTFSSTIGIITPNAYTDSSGRASVILSSEYEAGWAQVTGTCGSATASMLIQFVPDSIGQVILAVNPIELTADGSSTADVTVTVLDINDHPIADGTPILFSGLNLGLISPPVVTTTDGSASATLTSFTLIGGDTLIASCGSIADSVELSFVAGPPANIVLTPNSNFLISDGTDTTTVTATVTDAANNPVEDGTVVHFSVDPSDMGVVWSVAVTADTGRCKTLFQAGTQPGIVAVHATSGGADGTCVIELVPPDVASIELSVADHYLPGDGVSSTEVTAIVFDTLGLPAPNGTGVHFAVTDSSVPANLFPAWSQTTDGIANVQLIAPTDIGICSVYAYIDTGDTPWVLSDTEIVYFEGGEPQAIVFNPPTFTLPADGATDTVGTLTVIDRYGNPIGATPVSMTLDLGRISPATVVTDTSGRGTFQITSSIQIGDGVVQADASPATGYMNVHYTPVPVDTILVFATPSRLPADGTSQSTITAIVMDSLGRLCSDGMSVYFYTDNGFITPHDTTVSGQAHATLTAVDTVCTATVTVVCQSESAYTNVIFTAGVPDTIIITFSQDMDTVGSGTVDSISGLVLDTLGNNVGAGALVELWLSTDIEGSDTCGTGSEACSLGTIGDITVLTDSNGQFSTQFTPGTKAGIVWIQARSGDAIGKDYMILEPEIAHTESIDVDRNHIYVRGSGNIDQAILTAYILDRYGNPVKDSTKILFWCTNYPGDDADHWPSIEPEHPVSGQLYSDTIYTLNGRGNVTIRAGKASGVVVVRCEVFDGSGLISESPRISISSGLPYNISMSAMDCNVAGWIVDGVQDTVMAIVSDSMDNPCPNTAVYFTCDEGVVTGSAVTDSNGIAYGIWFSADPRDTNGYPTAGRVWVEGRTRGDSSAVCDGDSGWVCDSTMFYNSGPAESVYVAISPSSLNADGLSTADVVVLVFDHNRNPVVDSSSVHLLTNLGSVTDPITTYNECFGSRADGVYTSAVLDQDDYCVDPRCRTATVTALVGFAAGSDDVDLMNSDPSPENSSVSAPSEVPVGGGFSAVVTVKDIWGNPICGESVTLISAVGATITGSPGVTNNSGIVSFGVTAATDTVDIHDVLTATFSSCAVWTPITYTAAKGVFIPDTSDSAENDNLSPIYIEKHDTLSEKSKEQSGEKINE